MPNFFRLTLKTTSPVGFSATINDGALYTNTSDVTLTVSVTDTDTSKYQMKVWGIASSENKEGALWEPFTEEKSIVLPDGDGLKTVYVKARDDDGNETNELSIHITLSTEMPMFPPVMLNALAYSEPEHEMNVVEVYDKNKNLIAVFDGDTEGLSEESKHDLMVRPLVHIETNGSSTLSFQMLTCSAKWNDIKDPENLYYLNGRWYTALNDNAYKYTDENGVSVVSVTAVETWYLLDRKYNQAYNCGVYCYAKAHFTGWVNDGARFTIYSYECSNPSNTITSANAWSQVKKWTTKDADGNYLVYAILTSDNYKPAKWDNAPSGVHFRSFSVSGSSASVVIESLGKTTVKQTFDYKSGGYYYLKDQKGNNLRPIPAKLEKVSMNFTTTTKSGNKVTYTTKTQDVPYTYYSSDGSFRVNYSKPENVTVNGIIAEYKYNSLGDLKTGATCTFAFGAEAIDEHTFVILPKADTKYKLTVNGVEYNDSQVRDGRGAVMPRGSGGYAMWAALKDSGWSLGVCDVIATGFKPSEDYGCFNIESDMKDVLYNVQYIQQLYGGILDWDSENKVLNYRGENYKDYQAYRDGFNDWVGVEFREGKNMLEQPIITYDNKLITKAYLLGYGNLNVGKVNGGKNYVTDFSYTNDVYEGYLTQSLIYDTLDEGGQKQLLYWGKKELAKQCKPRRTVSFSVQDMRDMEDGALSHEVFDINDIVRVYYRDKQDGTENMVEQRVILWEYNAFAMWDSKVELGDKTKNLVDLFHLIYKSTKAPAGSNASGEISSGTIDINGSGDGNDYSGLQNGNTLEQYIQLIARTTTENSDAIAGLILDTSETHAQVDLFAQYQHKTDDLFTQTYSGLQFYADKTSATAKQEAYLLSQDYTNGKIKEANSYVLNKVEKDYAKLEAFSTFKTDTTYAISGLTNKVSDISAEQTLITQFIDGTGTNSLAGVIQEATKDYAKQSMVTKFINGEGEGSLAYIIQEAQEDFAEQYALAELGSTVSGLVTKLEEGGQKSTAIVTYDYETMTGGYIEAMSNAVTMYADYQNQYNSSISLYGPWGGNHIAIYHDGSGYVSIGEYVYIMHLNVMRDSGGSIPGGYYKFVPYSFEYLHDGMMVLAAYG